MGLPVRLPATCVCDVDIKFCECDCESVVLAGLCVEGCVEGRAAARKMLTKFESKSHRVKGEAS